MLDVRIGWAFCFIFPKILFNAQRCFCTLYGCNDCAILNIGQISENPGCRTFNV